MKRPTEEQVYIALADENLGTIQSGWNIFNNWEDMSDVAKMALINHVEQKVN